MDQITHDLRLANWKAVIERCQYTTLHLCSWENYQGFINIIEKIRSVMEDLLPMQGVPRLIDAHSFVWMIQEDQFRNWIPDVKQSIQIVKNMGSSHKSAYGGAQWPLLRP